MGQGENAGNQHFLLFPRLSTISYRKIIFLATVNLSSSKCFQFGLVQNLLFGKELRLLSLIFFVLKILGDELYPTDPDFEGLNPPLTISGTIVSLREKYPNMNRSEFFMKNGNFLRNFFCNVKMRDGRAVPNFDVFTGTSLQSNL